MGPPARPLRMSHVSGRVPALLVVPVGVGVMVAMLAATQLAAQTARVPTGLRTTMRGVNSDSLLVIGGPLDEAEYQPCPETLVFNHLFAGLEAYVGAHLADFPGDLNIRAVPGGVGASLSVPVRLR